jgi:hypothetical protein
MENDTRDENVDRLLRMFESLANAKLGKVSLDDAEKKITDEVNDRYLYSVHGSKENFERALMSEVQNEKRKKNQQNVEELRNIGKVRIKQ